MNGSPDQDADVAAGGSGEEQFGSELESLRAALVAAEGRILEIRDAHLRAMAEADNVRKRAQRDIEAAQRYGIERFAADLLEVYDNLERGIEAARAADSGAIVEGMEATLRLLARAFERAGIAVVDPQGEAFNPELHEAMTTQESAEHAAGTVLTVVQKGYTLNGRLLRPARVVIARAPATA